MDPTEQQDILHRASLPMKIVPNDTTATEGESEKARIERLGRQRPEKLGSAWQEAGFVFSIVISQLLNEYYVTGFLVLSPVLQKSLDISASSAIWPAAAFSLTSCCFQLPFGRLADIYGGFTVYIAGIAWMGIWSSITAFSTNGYMLDVCRAMQGLGPAAFLPAGLQLLGSMYRPGPRKNLIFSTYGAMAPFGLFVGILVGGIGADIHRWSWYFMVGAMIPSVTLIVAFFSIPNDYGEHVGNGVKMDWWGSATTVVGFVLVVFAITDSSQAPSGWSTPYIGITLVGGLIVLGAAVYVEGWVAEQPLLPFHVFKIKYVTPFLIGLTFVFGTQGTYTFYATLYARNIMGAGQMQLVAWFLPTCIGGMILAICGGSIMHLLPTKINMFITAAAIIIESLLFALQPPDGSYWAWVFPAMCCLTISIDFIFNVSGVFFSTKLPARQQGLAGALTNTILQGAIALGLGFGQIVATKTTYQGERQSYKNVFWFNLALGVAALVVFLFFVRIDRAVSDLTADEKIAAAQTAISNDPSGLPSSVPQIPVPRRGAWHMDSWSQESWIRPFDFETPEVSPEVSPDGNAVSELRRSVSSIYTISTRSSAPCERELSPHVRFAPEPSMKEKEARLEHPLLRRPPPVATWI